MLRKRLHYLTRQPNFILRIVLVILIVGIAGAYVADRTRRAPVEKRLQEIGKEAASKPGESPPEGDFAKLTEREFFDLIQGQSLSPDLSAAHEMLKKIDLPPEVREKLDEFYLKLGQKFEKPSGAALHRKAVEQLEQTLFPPDRKALFKDFLDATWLEGVPRVEAQKRVEAAGQSNVVLANEMLGVILESQKNIKEAVAAYVKEGERAEATEARFAALALCIEHKLEPELRALRGQPLYEAALTEFDTRDRNDAAILSGDYGELLKTTAMYAWEEAVKHPSRVVLTLLCGVVWFFMLHQLGGVSTKFNWRSLLAVALGTLSPVLVLFVLSLQSHYNGLEQNGEFLNDLLYFVVGVGLREEVCKLLLFVPFLWLLRNKSDADVLVTAGCVGLGFAIEENINYFAAMRNVEPLGRFLTANFLHIALTAIAGLGLARWVRFPRSFMEQGIVTILAVILLHGFYDFSIAAPVHPTLSFQPFTLMILMGIAQFFLTDLRRYRNPKGNVVSPLFAFLTGVALLSIFALAEGTLAVGFKPALEAMIESGLGSALLIFLFGYHLRQL